MEKRIRPAKPDRQFLNLLMTENAGPAVKQAIALMTGLFPAAHGKY
jgi:hypothetical protein